MFDFNEAQALPTELSVLQPTGVDAGCTWALPLDTDDDEFTDAQDGDSDNDGVGDASDNDPQDPYSCEDSDLDGCDDCSVGVDTGELADNTEQRWSGFGW